MSVSFDRVAHLYDATRGMPEEARERVADEILRLSGATPESCFVEPGIGTGRIALPLVRRGYHYTGVDISGKMLDELRRKTGGRADRLRLEQADATALPFADDSFDIAVSAHVLHLVSDWRAALAEIRRVLRPDGLFLYCHQEHGETSTRATFHQQWHDILSRYDAAPEPTGATKPAVLDELRGQGAGLETVAAAGWQTRATVEEVLERYAGRVYSSEWRLPDEVFEAALQELRGWADERYPAEAQLVEENTFEITAARGWAGG